MDPLQETNKTPSGGEIKQKLKESQVKINHTIMIIGANICVSLNNKILLFFRGL